LYGLANSRGNLLIVVLEFRCDHGVKIELDMILVVGNPSGRDYRPG
jgi:hypothetical protein